jgi:uncharacterized protein (TIGR02444 family)
MTSGLDLDGPHWRFALALYGQDGAADACLALQDRLGLDVNILLLAMFAAAERGIAVTSEEVRSMDALVSTWRAETVAPLRTMRRRLKQPLGPDYECAELLRPEIKKAELLAEQIEQALLARWLSRRSDQRNAESADFAAVLWTVVAYFVERAGLTAETQAHDVEAAVRSLVLAARRLTSGTVKSS